MARRKVCLDRVKMHERFSEKDDYLDRESALQMRMLEIQQAYFRQDRRAVIVFEGWDAAGKGGSIRRLTARLDPRAVKVWPIGAPSAEEQGRHYLYRFWSRLPIPGNIAVFDRSWYGRVLVERVENLIAPEVWERAYDEINEFEHLLSADGVRVVKLFLHIDPDEQAKRFASRLKNPVKRWKLTHDDLRNRGRWDDYAVAYDEMFARTSTRAAPWSVIGANNKWTARTEVMGTIAKVLAKGIDTAPPEVDPSIIQAVRESFGESFLAD
jgi:polyphosphate kinase 2 (PPK2 family)